MAVIAHGFILCAVTESGLSAYFTFLWDCEYSLISRNCELLLSRRFQAPVCHFIRLMSSVGYPNIQKIFESDPETRAYIFLQARADSA
jgi:hypothetical protein